MDSLIARRRRSASGPFSARRAARVRSNSSFSERGFRSAVLLPFDRSLCGFPARAAAIFLLTRLAACACSKLRRTEKGWRFLRHRPTVAGMITFLSTVVSILGFRLRRRASLELELIALRHQVSVLR